jgi:predicted nucleic acid-binding protein
MSQFLLDSNVISELWRNDPAPEVLDWLDTAEWLIPVVIIAEIQEGAESAPSITRKEEISRRLADFLREFSSLVVDWDAETAQVWARLRHSPEVKRQPQSLWESLIDAMAVRYGAAVATRNTGDFRHATTFNPWIH